MKIAIIDGLGGGLGCKIVKSFKNRLDKQVELITLGTNSIATSKMLNEGADRGATGENAILVTAGNVDVIVGPLGIIIPNSMLGEVTESIAEAIASSQAKRYLLGIKQPHVELVGIREEASINDLIEELTDKVNSYMSK